MTDIRIELAQPSDDQALRELQAESIMPGPYRISYLREPGYFKALNTEGRFHQTVVARDQATGKIIGWGNRAVKQAWINGRQQNIGYLSGLRFISQYNNIFTLFRGYSKMRQLHKDGRTGFYFTTILDTNLAAHNILTSGKKGLPKYLPYGRFHCKAVSLAQARPPKNFGELSLRQATRDDLGKILQFLHDEGQKKQLYPVYRADDFSPEGLLPGLAVENLVVALIGDKLVGVAGAWDQLALRASLISGYSGWLAAVRPVYNLWAHLKNLPTLPQPGTKLNYFTLSLIAVQNDDPSIFLSLVNELMLQNRDRHDCMLAGLHETHPLYPVLQKLKGTDYPSRLYLVYWEDGAKKVQELDQRPIYLELGGL